MEKVYLNMYLNYNIGDDLFAKIVSERYPETNFCVFMHNKVKYKFKNIKIYSGFTYKAINKALKLLSKNRNSIPQILAKKCKTGVVVGGSMFIEGKSNKKEELLNCENAFIIGSNFGPFKDSSYPESFYKLFKKCKCVSFRDEYSYNLFKHLGDNIQYASDIVFSLDTSNINIKESNKVIFSIIDCKNKMDAKYEADYDKKMIELTRFLMNKNYEIVYMSFCKNEGDEEAINRIISKMEKNEAEKISTYFYNGNIDESLNVLADSKIIVGSRFHANILGLVLNKTVIPVIYSDKTLNTLNDIKFEGKQIDIREINKFNVNELTQSDLDYKKDISEFAQNAQKHFTKLDEMLKQ